MPKLSPGFIAFLQALGLLSYCSLIGSLLISSSRWFGPNPGLFGPAIFLLLFVFSAIVCTAIFFGYPFLVFWEHKQIKPAFRLVSMTTAWLFLFLLLLFILLALSPHPYLIQGQ